MTIGIILLKNFFVDIYRYVDHKGVREAIGYLLWPHFNDKHLLRFISLASCIWNPTHHVKFRPEIVLNFSYIIHLTPNFYKFCTASLIQIIPVIRLGEWVPLNGCVGYTNITVHLFQVVSVETTKAGFRMKSVVFRF